MNDPSPLYRVTDAISPPNPVLIVALEGWVDAGLAGATAMATLLDELDTTLYARFDSEVLLDQRARRPKLRIVDGINEELDWPEVTLRVGTDVAGAGIALLTGPEPDMRWRRFSEDIAELALALDVRLMVGLGGFPAGAPHTRPVKLAATASDSQLAKQVGFIPGAIEVPAGIQAAIERACSVHGIPSVGLWARVPHYVAAMPFPAASLALLDGLADIAGLVIDSSPPCRGCRRGPVQGRRAHRPEQRSSGDGPPARTADRCARRHPGRHRRQGGPFRRRDRRRARALPARAVAARTGTSRRCADASWVR